MRTIARFMDARNTAEGKFLSVLLSVLLVFSFLNVTMFTDYAGADTTSEGDGTEIVTPLEDVEEPEAQSEDKADGPESGEPAEEVNETEPAAEPEAPAVAEEPEAAEQPERHMNEAATSTYKVTLKKIGDDSWSEEAEIQLGSVKDAAELIDSPKGFAFAYARFGDMDIKAIQFDPQTGSYYVVGTDGSVTGTEVLEGDEIVFYYEKEVSQLTVSYAFFVDGVEQTSIPGKLIGANSVKQGESLEFSFVPDEGYTVSSIIVNGKSMTADASGKVVFSETGSQDKVNVRFELDKITKYSLVFTESSNTYLVYNGKRYASGTSSNHSQTHNLSYEVTSQLQFSLESFKEWGSSDLALNKLTVQIASDKVAANVPVGSQKSATTTLATGVTITVSVNDPGAKLPKYDVVISAAPGKELSGDITVTTNCKDKNSSEIWPSQLTGVSEFGVYNHGWQNNINPATFTKVDRDGGYTTYIFFKVEPGYSDNVDDIKASALLDGEDTTYPVLSVDSLTSKSIRDSAKDKGYKYYIEIPADKKGSWGTSKFSPKDIRVSVVVKALKRTFAAQFQGYDDGSVVVAPSRYVLGENMEVSDGLGVLPAKDGFVFQGWRLGNGGKIYSPSAIITIDQVLAQATEGQASDGAELFVFHAVWEKADSGVRAPYNIYVSFADENGAYGLVPDLTLTDFGAVGKRAFVVEGNLAELLSKAPYEKPANWQDEYVLDEGSTTSTVVQESGTAPIVLKYQRAYTVTFEPGDASCTTDTENVVLKKVRRGTMPQAPEFSAKPGYKFVGWSEPISEVTSDKTYVAKWDIDESQTKPTSYSVEYYKDGAKVEADSYSVNGTAWINEENPTIEVERAIDAAGDKYVGYKLDSTEPADLPAAGEAVASGSVFKVKYVKDEGQTQPTSYTVKHVVGGVEMAADTKTYHSTAWINDESPEIAIQEGSLAQNTYAGYKYTGTQPSAVGEKVASGATISLIYVRDDGQTKPTSYSVEYYKDGAKVEADSYSVNGTAWINEENPTIEVERAIDAAGDKYVGYKLDSTEPADLPAAGEAVASGSVFKVKYVKDEYAYRVDRVFGDGTPVPLSGGMAKYGQIISVSNIERHALGLDGKYYTLQQLVGNPLTIDVDAKNPKDATVNVIRAYYYLDNNQDDIPDEYQITVRYQTEDSAKGVVSENGDFEKTVTLRDDVKYLNTAVIVPGTDGVDLEAEPGWAFDSWNVNPNAAVEVKGGDTLTYTAQWAEDVITDPTQPGVDPDDPTKGDGIPDKYQATVTYQVIHGTFGQGGDTSITEVVTLAERDSDGNWQPTNAGLNVPDSMVPAVGYDQQPGTWGDADFNAKLEGGSTYTFTYVYGINNYSVNVSVANGTSNVGEVGTTGTYGSDLAYAFAPADGYALDSVSVDGQPAVLTNGGYTFSALNANHSISVVYAIDSNRDGIPDSRQAIVNYNVANGTWADGTAAPVTEYVNMYAYRNGEWEPVEPVLNVPAGMVANAGYSQASGAWRVNPAASQLVAGGEVTFTYAFAAIPTVVVPPATPVTPAAVTPAPTPAAPAAPATPAPAAPAAAAPAPAAEPIEDDATPQAAAAAERTPLAETEEIEDEATPMGAFDEPHCWVHWVMLLGILVTAAYGLVVVRRRLHLADDVDDYEKQVLGIEDEATEAVPATGRQAL